MNEVWARDIDQIDLIVLSFGHWFMDVPSIYYFLHPLILDTVDLITHTKT